MWDELLSSLRAFNVGPARSKAPTIDAVIVGGCVELRVTRPIGVLRVRLSERSSAALGRKLRILAAQLRGEA